MKLRELRKNKKMSMKELGNIFGLSESTISLYETGGRRIDTDMLQKFADFFDVSVDYLLDREYKPFPSEDITMFDVIGSVSAGYNGIAVEEPTGDQIPIPSSYLRSHDEKDFFVLRIKGDSMYPRLLDGDNVLVERTTSVDSGSIAVVLYNGNEATVKRVEYVYGEDWLELIPFNPEYKKKRIEGAALEQCRVLGKVVKLIRDM